MARLATLTAILCWLCLGLTSCDRSSPGATASTPPGESAGPLSGWHYVMRIEDGLQTASLRVCFVGRPPERLIPGTEDVARFATAVHTDDGTKLRKTRRGVDLRELPAGECVTVDLDLQEMADAGGRRVMGMGDSLVTRPSAWLWRPSALPRGAEVTLRFELPEGYDVSVPWPTVDGSPATAASSYALDKTAFRWLAYTAFGHVERIAFEHLGTDVEIVTPDHELACSDAGLRTWIEDAMQTVSGLFEGKFPRDELQVVVVPVEGRGGSIYFGMAGRGGGTGIYILLDDEAPDASLLTGWTTVHELLHHGMPFIREPWMGEGFVTYYTDLLMGRAGKRDEVAAWEHLADGFARGNRGGRGFSLQDTSARMHEIYAYARVYWGGAAVAFLIDVALREDSGGKVTMDDAMRQLRTCCGDADKRWKAADLLTHLDTWYGKPLFTETAEQALQSRTFPDVEAAFAKLGIELDYEGNATLIEEHPGAAMRRSIMLGR